MVRLSQKAIALARDDFFRDGKINPDVRPEITNSWRRSAQLGVHPGSETAPRFTNTRRSDTLWRAADPVVRRLLAEIGEDNAAMLLLNTDGVVVGRWSASRRINRTLDESRIEPGRMFDEASAGTTGLGTPLENGRTAVIEGAEHTLAVLDSLTAAGTPILHPTRGSIEGVIDIVGSVGVEPTMMIPLVTRAARDIGERLVAGFAADDRALMDAFLRAERRGPKRPMLAINDRLIIGNTLGNELGVTAEHLLLWEAARDALSLQCERIAVSLSGGRELRGRVVGIGEEKLAGAIVHLDDRPQQLSSAAALSEGPELRRTSNETAFDDLERTAIRRALAQTGGNRRDAAEVLGVSRATLYRKIARLRIRD